MALMEVPADTFLKLGPGSTPGGSSFPSGSQANSSEVDGQSDAHSDISGTTGGTCNPIPHGGLAAILPSLSGAFEALDPPSASDLGRRDKSHDDLLVRKEVVYVQFGCQRGWIVVASRDGEVFRVTQFRDHDGIATQVVDLFFPSKGEVPGIAQGALQTNVIWQIMEHGRDRKDFCFMYCDEEHPDCVKAIVKAFDELYNKIHQEA
jgi:hypothetical protein